MAKQTKRTKRANIGDKGQQGEKDLERLKEIATPAALQVNSTMINLLEAISTVITVGDKALLAQMKQVTDEAYSAADEALNSDKVRTH